MESRETLTKWAQVVMKNNYHRVIVLDTTGLGNDADVIRVLAMDMKGIVTFSQIIRSVRYPLSPNTLYTGISQEEMNRAPTLTQCWPLVRQTLRDCDVLAYGLDFVRERLKENAVRYDLAAVWPTGDCLHESIRDYLRIDHRIKLVDACARVGHHVPTNAVASDRAAGQLALLKAIAEGVPDAYVSPDDEMDELEDHPF